MQRLFAILLALAFVAMPLRILASERCACLAMSSPRTIVCAEQEPVPSCCGAEVAENDPSGPHRERDEEPCEGCDCTLACCGISKTMAAVSLGIAGSPPRLACERIGPAPLAICGSPHISRLKRPPRPVTIAA